jgi:hypothetical protein
MKTIDINALSEEIGRYLRLNRTAVMQESTIHDGIALALADLGIEFEREHRLDAHARLDFWLPEHRHCIEVKKNNVGVPVLTQLGRYFSHAKVEGCILIAMKIHPKVPTVFSGKPIAHLSLWKYLL